MPLLESEKEDDETGSESNSDAIYESLHELVEANKEHLKRPCAGSELSYLFGDNVGKLGYDLDSSSDEESTEEDNSENHDSESDDEYRSLNDSNGFVREDDTNEDH